MEGVNPNAILDEDLRSHIEVFMNLSMSADFLDSIVSAADLITESFKNGGRVLLCGNGGSAADAQHIAAEFSGRFLIDREPLDAEALTTNSSSLTAISNDYGYETVFSRQVRAKGKNGDVFIGISTSGSSKNVIEALTQAKTVGMGTVMLCGAALNGDLMKFADVIIRIPCELTPRIQEGHIFAGHTLCNIVEQRLFKSEPETAT